MIRRIWSRLRSGPKDDDGFTLAEVMVSVSLMLIVGVTAGSTLVTNFNATGAAQRRSQGMDDLRVSVGRIEKEFRSAECVYEPVIMTPGGSATGARLRFKTRLNSGAYEVTYRVEAGTLYRTDASGDQAVATDLVNPDATFTLSDTTRRRLDVALAVQPEGGSEQQALETSIAGRNAWRDC